MNIRALYSRIIEYAHTPKAIWAYGIIAFTESFIFPLPPDLLMVPMILSKRELAFRLAFLGTILSVLGGIVGYTIGYTLSHTVGAWIIETYGLTASANKFYHHFKEWGFWIIVLKALTPIPFKLVTIASGMAHFPLMPFIVASTLARAFRFFLLASLIWIFGPTVKPVLEKHLPLFLMLSLGAIVLGFGLIWYF